MGCTVKPSIYAIYLGTPNRVASDSHYCGCSCHQNAICLKFLALPVPQPGYYASSVTTFVSCVPAESCPGVDLSAFSSNLLTLEPFFLSSVCTWDCVLVWLAACGMMCSPLYCLLTLLGGDQVPLNTSSQASVSSVWSAFNVSTEQCSTGTRLASLLRGHGWSVALT